MKKFLDHNFSNDKIYNSYIKEEWRNDLIRYGVITKAGYNPNNPNKVNQDSYVIQGDQK